MLLAHEKDEEPKYKSLAPTPRSRMSIELLRQVSAQKLPVDCSDDEIRDGLLVLRSAGLIAAFTVRKQVNGQASSAVLVRVLAVTPAGWRLLERERDPSAATSTA